MQRLIFYIALMVLGYFLIKKIMKSLFGPSEPKEKEPPTLSADAELIQDPNCGKYFMKQQGVKGIVDGKVIRFCSEECYEKYLKRQKIDER